MSCSVTDQSANDEETHSDSDSDDVGDHDQMDEDSASLNDGIFADILQYTTSRIL